MLISNIKLQSIGKEILVTISGKGDIGELSSIAEKVNSREREYTLELKPLPKQASRSQFQLCWAKIGEIANKERCSKKLVYEECLRRYGQSEVVRVNSSIVHELENVYRIVDVLKTDESYCDCIVYPGIEHFNSDELSIFTDGVIDEWKTHMR